MVGEFYFVLFYYVVGFVDGSGIVIFMFDYWKFGIGYCEVSCGGDVEGIFVVFFGFYNVYWGKFI